MIDTPISEATILGAGVGMALAGLKPVVEMRVVDFALCAMDEIVNQAAKARYMFGGQGRVPLVARLPIGLWSGSAAQHSQSLEAWFAHMPGLVVVTPATPQDNYSLLRAALDCGDPVIYMEHKELWGLQGEVSQQKVELGKARVVREGKDLTLVTWSRTVHAALEAAEKAKTSVEVIDLRTLWPWDRETVLSSVRKTGKLLVVHEAVQAAGFGAEIAATVAEELGVPVKRLGAPRIPVGYSKPLEDEARITAARIVAALTSGSPPCAAARARARGRRWRRASPITCRIDERHDAAVDVRHVMRRRHGALHVEQREAEGRGQERGLQVHRHQDDEPGQEHDDAALAEVSAEVDAFQHRREHRQHDQADLDPVEEEAEHEHQRHHEEQDLPAGVHAERLQQRRARCRRRRARGTRRRSSGRAEER